MTLYHVRLELAREKDHPTGSERHGYEFTAPLDELGHLDAARWRQARRQCLMRRFWVGEDDRQGELIHTKGGRWAFSYDPSTDTDDEAIFRLDRHTIRAGEYLSITEPEGEQHTFRVVRVAPVQ